MKLLRETIRNLMLEQYSIQNQMEALKKYAEVDGAGALEMARAFPDFTAANLDFLFEPIKRSIHSNISDTISSNLEYPTRSEEVTDLWIEFSPRPKRFQPADGMNLTDAQVEERYQDAVTRAELAEKAIPEIMDIIINEFDLLEMQLLNQPIPQDVQVTRSGALRFDEELIFEWPAKSGQHTQMSVEIGIWKNEITIDLL